MSSKNLEFRCFRSNKFSDKNSDLKSSTPRRSSEDNRVKSRGSSIKSSRLEIS
jgi:hypothetical protein